jgi:hypothetical protein
MMNTAKSKVRKLEGMTGVYVCPHNRWLVWRANPCARVPVLESGPAALSADLMV